MSNTIDDIRIAKADLERLIESLLNDFERDNGVDVTSMSVELVPVYRGKGVPFGRTAKCSISIDI